MDFPREMKGMNLPLITSPKSIVLPDALDIDLGHKIPEVDVAFAFRLIVRKGGTRIKSVHG